MAKRDVTSISPAAKQAEEPSELLRELVASPPQNERNYARNGCVPHHETRLLTAMTKEEIFAEATSIYDSYVEALDRSI